MIESEELQYMRKITELRVKHQLKFIVNPGGAEFESSLFGRCQVPYENFKEDYEILSAWIEEKLNLRKDLKDKVKQIDLANTCGNKRPQTEGMLGGPNYICLMPKGHEGICFQLYRWSRYC